MNPAPSPVRRNTPECVWLAGLRMFRAAQAAAPLSQAPYVRDAVPPSLEQDRIFLLLRAQANALR